jgi:hypothetical protein
MRPGVRTSAIDYANNNGTTGAITSHCRSILPDYYHFFKFF